MTLFPCPEGVIVSGEICTAFQLPTVSTEKMLLQHHKFTTHLFCLPPVKNHRKAGKISPHVRPKRQPSLYEDGSRYVILSRLCRVIETTSKLHVQRQIHSYTVTWRKGGQLVRERGRGTTMLPSTTALNNTNNCARQGDAIHKPLFPSFRIRSYRRKICQ